MPEPNDAQRALIEGVEGIHLVDAGAGTGKTFALTRRYANIVDGADVEPDDVLAVTFTRNAAAEMKERVVARSSYGLAELRDAPIQTFHSRCYDLLLEHGFDAPTSLGIDDRITEATRLLEDDLVEGEEFRSFFDRFSDDNPGYAAFYRIIDSPHALLGLIRELAAKGVFPTADGWYRDGVHHLDGDAEAFRTLFDQENQPRNDGNKQSSLRSMLAGFGRDDCYLPDAPDVWELRGEGKAVPEEVAAMAFEEDREALTRFVHDVYHGYLEYALSRNYLTFGMLQCYAYVLLCEDHALREAQAFDHVMVDEFQDTSEVQFKLALLMSGTDNLCVVGDWKQSIYGFQYAAVENIVDFEARLDRFVDELNADAERVTFDDRSVTRIELEENYRSTQAVLDFAERGLLVPATGTDEVDVEAVRERIVSLDANREQHRTTIEAIRHEDEHEALLTKLQAIAGNDAYAIEDDGEIRPPTLGDIAVLTRTKDYGRELLHAAEGYGIPMAYEGGIELFRTDQAKLVLAWLRILEGNLDRGWATVLERAGYTMTEIEAMLDDHPHPDDMQAFKETLQGLESVGAVAETVLGRYGYDGTYADVVIETLQDAFDATTMTRGDLIRFVERGIEQGATQEVSAPAGTDAVTVQTIHAAKGLEYPIVVLANMNRHRFPPSGGGAPVITFDDPIGLRQRDVYAESHGYPHVYDNWRADVLRTCLPDEYDEERRLLYVAMTRAQDHLVFSAGEEPNTFLAELPVEVEPYDPDVTVHDRGETQQAVFTPPISPPEGPIDLSAHDLMEEVSDGPPDGRGPAFGTRLHDFAEAYADGRADEPAAEKPDWASVMAFIDGLPGEKHLEEPVVLPLEVDGRRVAIAGVADLVHVLPDRVEVIDYKTDLDRRRHEEYRKQLSVYYHVLDAWFDDRPVTASILYTHDDELVSLDPLSRDELAALAAPLTPAGRTPGR